MKTKCNSISNGGIYLMARTNYSYEKRGRELEKQKKQEEKRQKRQAKKNSEAEETEAAVSPKEESSSEG